MRKKDDEVLHTTEVKEDIIKAIKMAFINNNLEDKNIKYPTLF